MQGLLASTDLCYLLGMAQKQLGQQHTARITLEIENIDGHHLHLQ